MTAPMSFCGAALLLFLLRFAILTPCTAAFGVVPHFRLRLQRHSLPLSLNMNGYSNDDQVIKDLRKNIEELRQEVRKENKELEILNKRIGGILGAFTPPLIYSLMEEAVYLSLEEALDQDQIVFASPKTTFENLQYQAAQTAGNLTASFLEPPAVADKVMFLFEKSEKNRLPGNEKTLRNAVYYGIAAFLKCMDEKTFEDWPPDRNPLVHNGRLLDCLCNPQDGEGFDDETMKTLRIRIKESVKRDHADQLEEEAVLQAFDRFQNLTTSWSATDVEDHMEALLINGP